MSNKLLFEAVQSYLAAHRYLQECQGRGACECMSEQRVHEARRQLEEQLSQDAEADTDRDVQQPAGAPGDEGRRSPVKTILVAIKDLDTDAPAVDTAGAYARAMGAKVVLMHVVESSFESTPEAGYASVEMLQYWRSNATDMLMQAKFRLPASVPSETLVREGSPAGVVMTEATRIDADLIVLGERGGGRWAHFLTSGTASAVIRTAACPVLVVNRYARTEPVQASASDAVAFSPTLETNPSR